MKLAAIPAQVVTANAAVVASLRSAHANTAAAQERVEAGAVGEAVAQRVDQALAAARDAVRGVEALQSGNLLDGTFQRYANHSVRELERAATLLPAEREPAPADLVRALFDAEVSTRLGADAGDRSLARPAARPLIASGATSSSASSAAGAGGPADVDGVRLDDLGNPARGSDTWSGPDGERFGRDGSAADGAGYVGPDGAVHTEF